MKSTNETKLKMIAFGKENNEELFKCIVIL